MKKIINITTNELLNSNTICTVNVRDLKIINPIHYAKIRLSIDAFKISLP